MLNPLIHTQGEMQALKFLSLDSSAKSTFLLQRVKKLEPNICHENRHLLSLLLLEYLGDPRRNIQMPKSLLMTAKEKSRPDLSARYLILSLFTEEVLINSVRGSTEFGVYSLNANKINALRGLLHVEYVRINKSKVCQRG